MSKLDQNEGNRPLVGIGIMVVKGNKVLMSQRTGSHGAGEYSVSGGHMEIGESIKETGLRELAEEAGPDLKVKNVRLLSVSNELGYLPKHYVNVGLIADWVSGEARQMEPDKQGPWEWYDISNPPQPLFDPVKKYLKAFKSGEVFFDSK